MLPPMRAVGRAPGVAQLLILITVALALCEPLAAEHRCFGSLCRATFTVRSDTLLPLLGHSDDVGAAAGLHDSHGDAHAGVETAVGAPRAEPPQPWRSSLGQRVSSRLVTAEIFRPPRTAHPSVTHGWDPPAAWGTITTQT
jgi:hypothetical protein